MGRYSKSALVVLLSMAVLVLIIAGSSKGGLDVAGLFYLIVVGGGSAFIPLFLFQVILDFVVVRVFKIEKITFIKCLLVALLVSFSLFIPYLIYELIENPNLLHEHGVKYFSDLFPFLIYLPLSAFFMPFVEDKARKKIESETINSKQGV